MAEYKLTPAALRDLEDIWDYTAEQWSIDQAETYVDGLLDAMETLAEQPQSGHSAEDLRPGYRRQSVGSHIVFYKLEARGITIVRILHQRMDFDEHL